MEAAAALTTTTGAQYSCCFGLAHGGAAQRRRRTAAGFGAARWSGRRLRALPPQHFLSPTIDKNQDLIVTVCALMLFFYFVSNWVVPELIMKDLQEPKKAEESEEAASSPAATMSVAGDGQPEAKIRLKVKKTKKNKKAAMKV
ncbi:hypothetical protein OsI_18299 [Oryza sativa Indica Group]|uniref:Uncharacterized protein n=2 Tax=Oryza sativa TaxID=4530 RepID=B9FGM6_ORYSJ|nr:hypothetical protein OsI_18299 [Oryza sativa Indica Group]EEE62198.1 hypothetical protein OsJ_16985 [Oryza sativa Japonica Group]